MWPGGEFGVLKPWCMWLLAAGGQVRANSPLSLAILLVATAITLPPWLLDPVMCPIPELELYLILWWGHVGMAALVPTWDMTGLEPLPCASGWSQSWICHCCMS